MSEYNAGVAFLSVNPSLRGFNQRLKRELAGINPHLDVPITPDLDGRALTGLQAQLRAALRTLPAVVLTADSSPADREVAALRSRIERLADQTVGIDISGDAARAEIAAIQSDVDRLANSSADIGVRVDAGAAQAALEGVERQARSLDGRFVRTRFDADTASAVIKIVKLAYAVNQFADKSYSFSVDANTFGAVASIAALVAKVSLLGGLGGVVGGFGGALAGLGAAGAVAAAGGAATIVGFLGVGDALSALNAQQEGAAAAAKQNATQQAAAANAIASAQSRVKQAAEQAGRARTEGARSVADAEKSASKQVDQALRQQATAQKTLRQATSDLQAEQADLTRAWEEGRRSLEDLQSQVRGNSIDQRQAALDLKDAEKDLREARAGGNAEAIERATIAYDRQKLSVEDLSRRGRELGTDNTAAQKAGVAGSQQVVAANERITAATERQQAAAAAAADADLALREARTDGAESVARAQEQASLRIADSDRQVLEAQRALTQAMAQTGDAGSAAADKVATAMADLGPEAQGFAKFLFGAKTELQDLSRVASAQLFPPLQAGLQLLLDQAPEIGRMAGILGGATGGALNTVLTALASPRWFEFYDLLAGASTTILPRFADSLVLAADVVRELLIALLPLAPAGFAILDQFLGLIRVLAPFIVTLLGGLIPAASAFLTALTPLGPVLAALQPILLVLGQVLGQVLMAVLQALAPILVALTPLIQEFATQWAQGLVDALTTAAPLLVSIAQFLSDNADTVVTLVTVVGGLVGALQPLLFILGFVVSALHGWLVLRLVSGALAFFGLQGTIVGTIITRLLSPISLIRLALPFVARAILLVGRAILGAMGPFGILLTVLSFLYSSNEEFRNTINSLLPIFAGLAQMLISAVMPAFHQILGAIQPLIPLLIGALMPILTTLAGIFTELVRTVLPPLIALLVGFVIPVVVKLADIFAKVLVWVITNVVVPAIQMLAWVVSNIVVPVLLALWQKVVQPTFQKIGDWVTFIWESILKPAFDGLVWLLENVVGPVLVWLWQNVVKPVFDGIATAISWAWENVLRPIFDHFTNVLQAFGDFFGWVFDSIIKPIFGGFVDFLSGNVAGIDRIWSGIKAIFSAPVKFVLDVVWNTGIGGLWDLAKRFGLPLGEFPRADTSGFAEGGQVPGSSPTKRSDNILARLTAGEFVQPVDTVDYYGASTMEAIRTRAIPRERLAAYASGGLVGAGVRSAAGPVTPQDMLAVLQQAIPGVRLTSGYRAGDPGFHGRNRAGDFAGARSGDAGAMMAINRWIASNYAKSAEVIYTPGINIKNGAAHTYSPAVRADHYDHVHWSAAGNGLGGGSAGSNFAGSASADVVDWFTSQVQGLFDSGTGFISDAVNAAFPRNGTFVGDLPANAADWSIAKTKELFFGKARAADDAAMVSPGGNGGSGVQQWRGVVLQALQMLGLPASLADTTLRRMNQESGGNPRAINNWDSNAAKGTPSKGLMQVIDPTYRANYDPRTPNDIWNPLSNIVASMKYAMKRYGSLPAAYNRKGGYDSGGIGKGRGWMWKGTLDDERVLDPVETQAYPTLTRLSQAMESGRLAPPTGGISDRQYQAVLAATRGQDGARSGAAVEIGEAHFHDSVGVDQLMQRAEFATRSRRF